MTTTPHLHGLASVAAALRSIGQIAESGGSLDEVRTLAGAALGICEGMEGAVVLTAPVPEPVCKNCGHPAREHAPTYWPETKVVCRHGGIIEPEDVGYQCGCDRLEIAAPTTEPHPSHGLQPDRPIRDGLDDLGVGESERTTEGADDGR